MPEGKLWVLLGPSGVGKDTILRAIINHPQRPSRLRVAIRTIDRPASDDETARYVSAATFDNETNARCFSLTWRANGCRYGIGQEIDEWLAMGLMVIINGSRRAWPDIRTIYPQCMGILLQADPSVVAQRLAARGRDDAGQIAERLARGQDPSLIDPDWHIVNNDGQPNLAAQEIIDWISRDSAVLDLEMLA